MRKERLSVMSDERVSYIVGMMLN